ncbi:dCTP deaminase [Staphylococcus sp. ACRSN]|uniref:dCTP deaminase n=1 Tax=Staphylococcus sp. ACRSN TaxID=2918214 RepID=UPI001EF168B3|nr:dCTP deaminase [Staphylococcus sp. ACRSN]MCG7338915.1 dCTP deaminase [Staphylococcus sp. ACRSN]
MILSDTDIKQYLQQEKIKITPFHENHIEPASIDLTLGKHYLFPQSSQESSQNILEPFHYKEIQAHEITIPAKSFVLATTNEYIELNNQLAAFVEGRSSIGRAGLFIQNAGWVDPGFQGNITLELYNANNFDLTIQENLRICQVVIAKTQSPSTKPYKGKYQGQATTTGSMSFKDKEAKDV